MATLILLALAILVPPFQGVYGQQQTFCSRDNRPGNLNRCLAAIRFRALDEVNSPYGEAYINRCPREERFNPNCFEPYRITEPKSLAELTFRVDNPDLSTIDRFLAIEYTSPAGSYTGCDHTYNYPNEKKFFIDPLSNNAYPSWDLREYPNIMWDHTEGEFFTLIILEPNWITRAVFANLGGDSREDFMNALMMYSYTGLINSQHSPRPISFILYKQTRQLFFEMIPSSGFNVTAFAERNQLQGPVAFSWVNAVYDAYSVELMSPYSHNCASLVQDALQMVVPHLEYLPIEVDLKVFLSIRHTTLPRPYDCGIYTITPPARDFYQDPIDPESFPLDTADLRLGTRTIITMRMNTVNPRPINFDGKLHTILMISSNTKKLHRMIVNIEGDNVTSQAGRTSSGFNPISVNVPNLVETGEPHFFSTLAYEQAARIPTTLDMTPYVSCSGTMEFTNMDEFISDHQLTLVGVSRVMFNDNDEYSRCRRQNA